MVLKLGATIERKLPISVERMVKGKLEEVELQGIVFDTANAIVKARLSELRNKQIAAVEKKDEDGNVVLDDNGEPVYESNPEAWTAYLAGSLRVLVPDMTEQEAEFFASYGHRGEKALEALTYLGYWRERPDPNLNREESNQIGENSSRT